MICSSVNLLFLMSAILLIGGLLYFRLVRLEGGRSLQRAGQPAQENAAERCPGRHGAQVPRPGGGTGHPARARRAQPPPAAEADWEHPAHRGQQPSPIHRIGHDRLTRANGSSAIPGRFVGLPACTMRKVDLPASWTSSDSGKRLPSIGPYCANSLSQMNVLVGPRRPNRALHSRRTEFSANACRGGGCRAETPSARVFAPRDPGKAASTK